MSLTTITGNHSPVTKLQLSGQLISVTGQCFFFNLRYLNTVSPGWLVILHNTARLPKITLVLRATGLAVLYYIQHALQDAVKFHFCVCQV